MDDQKIPMLLFSSLKDEHCRKIENRLKRRPDLEIILCSTMEEVSGEIPGILFGLGIILILIRDCQEMDQVLQLQQRLKDHFIILILGESEILEKQKGLDLYPRYISYIKDDYTDVFHVLDKMIMKIKRGEKNDGGNQCNGSCRKGDNHENRQVPDFLP